MTAASEALTATDQPLAIGRTQLTGAAFIIGALLSLWKLSLNGGKADFQILHTALANWRSAYDPAILAPIEAAANGRLPFPYPPTFLLLGHPFGLLPYPVAYVLWVGLGLSAFIFAASFLHPKAAWLLLIVPVLTVLAYAFGVPRFYEPILEAILLGQTSLWIGAGLVGAGVLLEKHPNVAAALLAIVIAIKPQAAIVAPVILWGRWPAVRVAVFTFAGLIVASLALGPERWAEWLGTIQTFRGGSRQIAPSRLIPDMWWSLALAGVGIWFAWTQRNLTGLLVGTIFCSPMMQCYDLAALCSLAAVWVWEWHKNRWLALIGTALLFGLAGNPLIMLAAGLGIVVIISTIMPASQRMSLPRASSRR